MMTKFQVGDDVLIVNAESSLHTEGDIGKIVSVTPISSGLTFYDVDVDGYVQGHYADDLVKLVSV